MFTDKCLHTFLKNLKERTGSRDFPVTNYTAEDAYLLRNHLRSPVEFNPSETNNILIEALIILVHSLTNLRNEDGAYLAACYIKAKELLDKVSPPNSKTDPAAFLGYPNSDLLYEISRFIESPLNVVTARIYGNHPEEFTMEHDYINTHECVEVRT